MTGERNHSATKEKALAGATRGARVYTRRFEWAEARARYAAGETVAALAAAYGVTPTAIYRVLNDDYRERERVTSAAWHRGGVCIDCGAPCSRVKLGEQRRCIPCAAKAQATSARAGELQCVSCRQWKPDAAYPHNRTEKHGRRGRHLSCRACLTEQRRAYREAWKVPCSHGCGTMVLHENGGKDPECRPCSRARIHQRSE